MTDKILKIHGDRITELESGQADIRSKLAADHVRHQEMNKNLVNLGGKMDEVNRSLGRVEGELKRMNGGPPPPPTDAKNPPRSPGLPLPNVGTKEWWGMMLITILGLPGLITGSILYFIFVF